MPVSAAVRCDQNRLFGCDRLSEIPGILLAVGEDRVRTLLGGKCSHCGLPLAEYRDATPSERAHWHHSVEGAAR